MTTQKSHWLPKLVMTDIDGVWTDGGMYYDAINGNEFKKFNTSDSAGVSFLRINNIELAIITGEDTEIVRRRAKKLGIEHMFGGIKDKVAIARQLCKKFDIDLSETAYIGDDLNDLALLKSVGSSACPANAPDYIRQHTDLHLKKRGGEGAFREFVEQLLSNANKLDATLDKFLANHGKPE